MASFQPTPASALTGPPGGISGARQRVSAGHPQLGLPQSAGRPARARLGLVLAALLALLLFLFGPGLADPAWAHPSSFGDVPTSHPAHDAIEYLAAAKVISGFEPGVFGPGRSLTRAQGAKILVGQRGIPPAGSRSGFMDVDSIYAPFVDAAAAKGWITGYPDGRFRPYEPLQRQHMTVILVRSLGWEPTALALSDAQIAAELARIKDSDKLSHVARPYVALALMRGLVQGDTSSNFNPTTPTARAQFALVAYRAELRTLAVVETVRFSAAHPDRTRVVVDLSLAPGKVTTSLNDDILTVDVSAAVAAGGGETTRIGSSEIESMRSTQASHRPPQTRLTLKLVRYSNYEVSVLKPSDGKGDRLVIDVLRRTTGPPGGGPPLVALDAGHGGSDSGAVGVTGLKEKDVNLAITLALDVYLRAAGIDTVLTRSGDTFPTLQDRARIANEARATIFVSVHNNAAADPNARGAETFYQGTPEKYSVEGRRLAEAIQKEVVEALGCVDRKARTHWNNLYVLNNTLMPAALVEVGFLTNAQEEALLKDPAYRARAAEAIGRGILIYLGWPTA
jgi:N-acetylmuramoyl-L-alanine amidase